MSREITEYYNRRAMEYEKIYGKPERQEELGQLDVAIRGLVKGNDIIEIACGTGYWTEKISREAGSVYAVDINESVLDIARAKSYPKKNVIFEAKDIFKLRTGNKYDSLFGGFIVSHIKLEEIINFVSVICAFVKPGGNIILLDNNYVEGSSTPVSFKDERGNTYQNRKLENGSEHIILKNFFSEDYFKNILKDKAVIEQFTGLKYYWLLSFRTFQQSL